jgi:hypothetical protein
MRWERTNRDGADYWKGDASLLRPVSIIAQALDNQWLPSHLLVDLLREGKSLVDLAPQRDRFVRREFVRAILNAEHLVANRAYLYNNASIAQFYSGKNSPEREALQLLMQDRALIPFLFNELSPHQAITTFDRDQAAFENWQELCRDASPHCIRMAWPDDDGADGRNDILIRRQLARPFHEYGKTANGGDAQIYASHLGIAGERVPAFMDLLDDVCTWFAKPVRDSEGGLRFRTRNEFYQHYLIQPGTTVSDGRFDPNRPFVAEIKRLVDLKYNVNLADAIGRYALTPAESPPRVALQETKVGQRTESGQASAEELTALLRAIVADMVHRQLDVPLLDYVSLQDVLKVRRDAPAWRNYIGSFESLLASISPEISLDQAAGPFNDSLHNVFENYSSVVNQLGAAIRQRQADALVPAVKITYGLLLTLAGIPIGFLGPATGLLFGIGCSFLSEYLPAGQPAVMVAKLVFRSPSRNDILELQSDLFQRRLPNAREELKTRAGNLRKLGCKETAASPNQVDEATINHGVENDDA